MRGAAAGLVILGAVLACGEDPGAGPGEATVRREPASVVLISLDTVRADHLGVYGYSRATSPELEKLAEHATVYTRAKAVSPWTLPSHASMFTGLYPFEHGARNYKKESAAGAWTVMPAPLAPRYQTLAEVLQTRGYRTGAFVANRAYLTERHGFAQGFDHYDNEGGLAAGINQRALRWLEQVEGRFFLFLNYMDSHRPYNCKPRDGFPDVGTPQQSAELLKGLIPQVLGEDGEPDAERMERLVDQYDLALANLDESMGILFRRLRKRGLYEDSLIVVVSDHGEYFGEHRLIEHGKDVYEGAMQMALIVKEPGQLEARVDEELVSHVHLPGLVLPHAGVPEPEREPAELTRHWPRRQLLGENHFAADHTILEPWGARFDRVRNALYLDRYKLIYSSDGDHELYDMLADGAEERDLASAESAVLRFCLHAREQLMSVGAGSETPLDLIDLTEEELQTLRELGYVGDHER